MLNRSKEEELVRVLEKILLDRCGLQARITVDYKEAQTGKYAEDDALKIQMRVNAEEIDGYPVFRLSGGHSLHVCLSHFVMECSFYLCEDI